MGRARRLSGGRGAWHPASGERNLGRQATRATLIPLVSRHAHNTARFVGFLGDLILRDVRGSIELGLDKHPAHVAAMTRRFGQEHADRLTIHYLPSDAADLNPDKHVWAYLKGLFRRDPLRPGEDLTSAVHTSMVEICEDRALVRQFVEHPTVALRPQGDPLVIRNPYSGRR